QMRERHVAPSVDGVMDHCVAMTKGATTAILSGETHAHPRRDEARQSQRLCCTPVKGSLAAAHFHPLLEQAEDLLVGCKVVRQGCRLFHQLDDLFLGDAGVDLCHLGLWTTLVALPNTAEPVMDAHVVCAARFAELELEL